jgi:hypothetical protein
MVSIIKVTDKKPTEKYNGPYFMKFEGVDKFFGEKVDKTEIAHNIINWVEDPAFFRLTIVRFVPYEERKKHAQEQEQLEQDMALRGGEL